MDGVLRVVLARGIRIAAHAVEGQRQNGLREGRVGVGVLGPAVHQQQEIALPSGRQRRQSARRRSAGGFRRPSPSPPCGRPARARSAFDVAVAGVVAGGGVPRRSEAHGLIVELFRLLALRIDGGRGEAAEVQIGRERGQRWSGGRAAARRSRPGRSRPSTRTGWSRCGPRATRRETCRSGPPPWAWACRRGSPCLRSRSSSCRRRPSPGGTGRSGPCAPAWRRGRCCRRPNRPIRCRISTARLPGAAFPKSRSRCATRRRRRHRGGRNRDTSRSRCSSAGSTSAPLLVARGDGIDAAVYAEQAELGERRRFEFLVGDDLDARGMVHAPAAGSGRCRRPRAVLR